jgi:hypothetical protein
MGLPLRISWMRRQGHEGNLALPPGGLLGAGGADRRRVLPPTWESSKNLDRVNQHGTLLALVIDCLGAMDYKKMSECPALVRKKEVWWARVHLRVTTLHKSWLQSLVFFFPCERDKSEGAGGGNPSLRSLLVEQSRTQEVHQV